METLALWRCPKDHVCNDYHWYGTRERKWCAMCAAEGGEEALAELVEELRVTVTDRVPIPFVGALPGD